MDELEFAERIARVRARFVANLTDNIRKTISTLPRMAGGEHETMDAIDDAYRTFHEACGISATVGLEATGQAAKRIDTILIDAFRSRRGLTANELVQLAEQLGSLQSVLENETKATNTHEELSL